MQVFGSNFLFCWKNLFESLFDKVVCLFFFFRHVCVLILNRLQFIMVKPDASAARAGVYFNLLFDAVEMLLHDCFVFWALSFFVLILSVCFDVDALNKLWISSAWVLLVWLSSKRSNQTPPQPFWQRSTLKPRRSTSLSFDSQAGQCIVGIDLDSLISLWQASCHMSVFCFQFTLLAW